MRKSKSRKEVNLWERGNVKNTFPITVDGRSTLHILHTTHKKSRPIVVKTTKSQLPTSFLPFLFSRGIRELDHFSRPDPVCFLYIKNRGNRQWKKVGRTEMIKNELEPEWARTFLLDYYFHEKQVRPSFGYI